VLDGWRRSRELGIAAVNPGADLHQVGPATRRADGELPTGTQALLRREQALDVEIVREHVGEFFEAVAALFGEPVDTEADQAVGDVGQPLEHAVVLADPHVGPVEVEPDVGRAGDRSTHAQAVDHAFQSLRAEDDVGVQVDARERVDHLVAEVERVGLARGVSLDDDQAGDASLEGAGHVGGLVVAVVGDDDDLE